jgi:hypothetical protein
MCDSKFLQDTAFIFLEDLKKLFLRRYSPSEIDNATSYSFNKDVDFRNEMIKRIEYYNTHPDQADNVSELKKGVLQFKDNVLDASDVLSQRDGKIVLIVKKADQLRHDSSTYYRNV